MPHFSLPGAVRIETPRRGVHQAGCLSYTPYAAECSQPLNSAKNRIFCLDCVPMRFVDELRIKVPDPLACLRFHFEHLPRGLGFGPWVTLRQPFADQRW
jgi:hypothetical protein